MKSYKYTVRNLDCANCAKKIEDKLSSYPEYKNVQLNFATLKLSLETDKQGNVKEDIQKIISSIEPQVKITEGNGGIRWSKKRCNKTNYSEPRYILFQCLFLWKHYFIQ